MAEVTLEFIGAQLGRCLEELTEIRLRVGRIDGRQAAIESEMRVIRAAIHSIDERFDLIGRRMTALEER